MKPFQKFAAIILFFIMFSAAPSDARVVKAKLERVPVKVQRLFVESAKSVKVRIKDERAPDPLIAFGSFGFGGMVGFYSEDPAAVVKTLETSVQDALPVLGLRQGEGLVLEITLKELRVDSFARNFSVLPHGIAYLHASAALRSAEGVLISESTRRITIHGLGPFNGLFARLGWALAATVLPQPLALEPDPMAVANLSRELEGSKDEAFLEQATFWAGIAGTKDPGITGKLLAVFRNAENWNVSKNALLALATLQAAAARPEIDSILVGATKLKNWDPKDAGRAWHLLQALSILGEKNLSARIPKVETYQELLADLVSFLEIGKIPAIDPKLASDVSKIREEAQKKLGR